MSITSISCADDERVFALMTLAFSADPATRWMFPDPQQYLILFPKFAELYAGRAFEEGAVHAVAGGAGYAMWLAPGVHSDDDGIVHQNIVDMAMFVDGTDSNGQGSLSVETARLSETFFRQLRQHAVPLDEAAIRHIHNSSMALDVYCRLAYRDRAPPRVQLKPPGQFLRAFTDCEMQGCARRATIGALRELRNMLGIFDTTTCRTNLPVGKRSRHG